MPGPFESAGAQKSPTKYGALNMGARQITGMVTQRSPYRDGAVPYLVSKFNGGTRFDTIWDGANREIALSLTDRRAPGSIVYNSNVFPTANSFFDWKYIVDTNEIVRVILDGVDGNIYDATAGQKSTILTKAAGAGPARMLAVNTELFIGDGVETKKVLRSAKTWMPNTIYNVGDFIVDPAGRIQSVQSNPITATIAGIQVLVAAGNSYVVVSLSSTAPVVPVNRTVSFSGLTSYTALNSQVLMWQGYSQLAATALNLTPNQIAFRFTAAPYGPAADTGSMIAETAQSGTSGATPPVWGTVLGSIVNDGGQNGGVNWTCFLSSVENLGIGSIPNTPPVYDGTNTLTIDPVGPVFYWLPRLNYANGTLVSIIDPNGNIQVANNQSGGLWTGGGTLPTFTGVIGGQTIDGTVEWICYGPAGAWYGSNPYGGASTGVGNVCVILDINGNLQGVTDFSNANTSGTATPAWATTPGGTTPGDGGITWICLGPGSVLWSGTLQYAWSPRCIDGTVGTASPITLVANGGLGPSGAFQLSIDIDIFGTAAQTDSQCALIDIWRTAQGKPTLILLDTIPNPFLKGQVAVIYMDVSNDLQLNAFIPAPVADAADPPPDNFLPMCYALQRQWGIVDNNVVWSAGPDAVTGNGLTQFPPLNFIPFLGKPYAIFPITVQDGGQVVFTSSGIWIILGSGQSGDPFYSRPYFQSVNVNGYNAVTLFNQQFFVIESNLKVSSVAVQFPFQPANGYAEVGFPIGDQFKKVTTAGFDASLFSSATSFMTWNNQSTDESALYVSDGAGHWFRMCALQGPEQGLVWSPLRTIAGGASAIQSVETSPGVSQLLIAPKAGTTGPILARDDSGTVADDNGTPYPAWDAKGVTLLCTTGQWSDIKHVSAKSKNTGGPRPTISVLFGEIEPSAERPYINLELIGKGNDPPRNRESKSVYSDRYRLAQQGEDTNGDCILVKFDYGTNAFTDELLDWGLYGGIHEEDEEQAAKA